MAIDFKSHPVVQTVVYCQGDIEAQVFGPENHQGTGWLLLRTDPPLSKGEDLAQEGVLLGAADAESVDMLIGALEEIRRRIVNHHQNVHRSTSSLPPPPPSQSSSSSGRASNMVFPLRLTSLSTRHIPGRRLFKVVSWPAGYNIPSLMNHIVCVDDQFWMVLDVNVIEAGEDKLVSLLLESDPKL